jgi:hypothetical protein
MYDDHPLTEPAVKAVYQCHEKICFNDVRPSDNCHVTAAVLSHLGEEHGVDLVGVLEDAQHLAAAAAAAAEAEQDSC